MRDSRNKAVALRKQGKTYSEIRLLIPGIPKSTLSDWLGGLELSEKQKEKLSRNVNRKLVKARARAMVVHKEKREEYFLNIEKKNVHLLKVLENNTEVAKLVLSALHLGEGSKTRHGSMQLGNSDPGIMKLFLKLLRTCYNIDETKFRCTIQCRADQNIERLEKFWAQTTGISRKQFYKARIDARTIGKPSRKLDYKGVCVIDYLSASVYHDLITLGKMMVR